VGCGKLAGAGAYAEGEPAFRCEHHIVLAGNESGGGASASADEAAYEGAFAAAD